MKKDNNLNIERVKKQVKKNEIPKVYDIIKKAKEHDGPPKGEEYSICTKCHEQFKQVLIEEQNRFTSFKICPKCRNKKDEKNSKPIETETQIATLPFKPFPWQKKAGSDFENVRFQVIAAANRCFTKGTYVNGCGKFVEDIKKGDFTFDEDGNYTNIINLMSESVLEDIYTIKSMGHLPFSVTEDHGILVTKFGENKKIIFKEYLPAYQVKEMIDSNPNDKLYVCMPKIKYKIKCEEWKCERYEKNYKNQIESIPINEDTAWMIGLYCAEGCCPYKTGSKFTLNYKSHEIINKLKSILESLNIHYNLRVKENEGTACIMVSKMQFSKKLNEQCGHGSINKKIPDSILYNADENILISFLKGYYCGDGHFYSESGNLTCSTVSRKLAIQIQEAWSILGFHASISISDRTSNPIHKHVDYNLMQKEEAAYGLLGYEKQKKKYTKSFIKYNGNIYFPIKSITVDKREETIYSVSTESESICANCIINHNCGKDRYTVMTGIKYFIDCIAENRHVDHPEIVPSVLWWQVAPTEKIALQNWRELKQYMPKQWVVACSDSTMTMQTIGNGIIEVRSAFDPEQLVSVGLDLVTITEAARIKHLDVVWANLEARLNSSGRGREKDRQGKPYGAGKAIINSSPIGKGFFYEMYKYGQQGSDQYSSNWVSYQLPWRKNPYLNELADSIVTTKYGEKTYEEDLRQKIGERLFRQNYLADFLAMDGTVFKEFEEKCVQNIYDMNLKKYEKDKFIKEWHAPIPYHSYRIGYDPATGSSADTPAVIVRDMDTNRIVQIVDLYGKSYDEQWDEIAFLSKRYNYAPCVWLRTGHTAVENQLAKRGVIEIPLDEQAGKKAEYIQSLERAIQNNDLHVLADGSQTTQTFIFQMEDYTEKGGKYSNDKQEHDDFVSACYAVYYDYSGTETKVAYCPLMGAVSR